MPSGDSKEIVHITRKEWNKLSDMVEDIHDRLCGNDSLGQKGLIQEHNDMYTWFLEQKWWGKKAGSIWGIIGGTVGIIGAIIAIIEKIPRL